MRTAFNVLLPTVAPLRRTIDCPRYLTADWIDALCAPYFDGYQPTRLRVRHNDRPCDMFVPQLPEARLGRSITRINPIATSLWRAKLRADQPELDPDSLPAILGAAILFERCVAP